MSDEQTITIEVDGQQLQAKPGQMLIEVTDAAGITVPRFCYHKHLSIAANCRMCLVEVEKAPKPLPACATPCNDGMKVYTKSPLAREAQKGTMEFLLINHPLDCPICDQGGECELQDVAMGYGGDVSRFTERKRVVPDPDIGPLVSTDMTRCIHCTRCVRFGDEIAGLRELGATGRGEHMKIGTYIKHAMTSELSGNVIDLCPVGALTSRPFRYTARAWEMTQHETVSPHDAVGSNLFVHVRRGKVLRAVPRENTAINQTWLSDRDRYSYVGLNHEDRLTVPMIRERGKLREASWEEALTKASESIAATKAAPDSLSALVSPTATLEEMYLLQKLARGIGSHHVDHRLRQIDFRGDSADPSVPWLGMSLEELESLNAALLIGSNVRKEQPLINHRLRKAAMNGAVVMAVNPIDHNMNYDMGPVLVTRPSELLSGLQSIAVAVGVEGINAAASETASEIAEKLRSAPNSGVLLGNLAVSHPDYSLIRDLASKIADASGSQIGFLPEAGNSVGAWLAGAVPHRLPGAKANETEIQSSTSNCVVLLGVEPGPDTALLGNAENLEQAATVVAMSAYKTPQLMDTATVLLPISAFTETAGSYVNAQGDMQSVNGVLKPAGETRPAWKVLRVLGNFLDLDGFDFDNVESVRDELLEMCQESLPAMQVASLDNGQPQFAPTELEAVPYVPAYATDAIVRRSAPLQATEDARVSLRISPATAADQGLENGATVSISAQNVLLTAKLEVDEGVADGVIYYPATVNGSGYHWGAVSVEAREEVTA